MIPVRGGGHQHEILVLADSTPRRCLERDHALAQALLGAGADINEKASNSWTGSNTALHITAEKGGSWASV
jgi:hypothetical protein